MAAGLGLILLLALTVGAVVLVVVVVLVAVRAPAPLPSEAARAAVRHGAVVHAVALLLLLGGLVVVPWLAVQVTGGTVRGVALGLAPAVAGLAFAGAQALGEATWPRPSGRVRRAPLGRRTVRDVTPRWLRAVTWGWAGLLAAVLVASGVASDDGRSIGRALPGGSAASGPFPGWYFGVPLLIAVVVVLLSTEGVLRLVAARPTVADADAAWDLSLRRLSAHRVLRGAQLVLAWTTAGVLTVAGGALRNVGSAVEPGVADASLVHVGLGVAALVLAGVVTLAGTVVALVPAPAVGEQSRQPEGAAPAPA